ncbi:hypothetical protein U1Q18_027633 [Sarracenia purpurea var. burkii]
MEASNLQRGFLDSSYPGDEDAFELWWARNWMLPLVSRDGSVSLCKRKYLRGFWCPNIGRFFSRHLLSALL